LHDEDICVFTVRACDFLIDKPDEANYDFYHLLLTETEQRGLIDLHYAIFDIINSHMQTEEKLKQAIIDILILAWSIDDRIAVLVNLEADNNGKEKKIDLFKKIIDIAFKDYSDDESKNESGLVSESIQYKTIVAELEKYAEKKL